MNMAAQSRRGPHADAPAADYLTSSGNADISLADAEAACRSLANVLRHCATSTATAIRARCEIAAYGAVDSCTAALRNAAASPPDSIPVEHAALAAEALLAIVGCDADSAAASGGSAASSVLAGRAASAGTEAAVRGLLGVLEAYTTVGGACADEEAAADLKRTLTALAAALQPRLAAHAGFDASQ